MKTYTYSPARPLVACTLASARPLVASTPRSARPLVACIPARTQLFEGNKVRIAWDAKQEYDYNNQRLSQFRRAIRIADGCEHVSSITNSFARKSQGTNEVGKLIVDGMTIGGHQQIAEIDKMINESREKSNKNFLLGTFIEIELNDN